MFGLFVLWFWALDMELGGLGVKWSFYHKRGLFFGLTVLLGNGSSGIQEISSSGIFQLAARGLVTGFYSQLVW